MDAAQYNIPKPNYAVPPVPGNDIGIFESLDVHYSKKDLDVFFGALYP